MGYGRWLIRNSVSPQYRQRTEVGRRVAAPRISTAPRKGLVGFQTLRRLLVLVQARDEKETDRKLELMLALAPSTAGVSAEKKWMNNPANITVPRLAVLEGGKKQSNE